MRYRLQLQRPLSAVTPRKHVALVGIGCLISTRRHKKSPSASMPSASTHLVGILRDQRVPSAHSDQPPERNAETGGSPAACTAQTRNKPPIPANQRDAYVSRHPTHDPPPTEAQRRYVQPFPQHSASLAPKHTSALLLWIIVPSTLGAHWGPSAW